MTQITVVLSEKTADATIESLKILKGIYEVQEKAMVTQPSDGSEWIQKLLDKLDHKQDEHGLPTGPWI